MLTSTDWADIRRIFRIVLLWVCLALALALILAVYGAVCLAELLFS